MLVWITILSIAIGMAFGLLFSIRNQRLAAYKVREQQLAQSVFAMGYYDQAFHEFMDLPGHAHLKLILSHFSENIATEAGARALAARLRDLHASQEANGKRVLQELEDLKMSRPGQAQLFEKAIAAGMLGTYLRWPQTALLTPQQTTELAIGREHEVAEVVRVTATETNSSHPRARVLAPA